MSEREIPPGTAVQDRKKQLTAVCLKPPGDHKVHEGKIRYSCYVVLCCAVLCCAVLCCAVLCCAVLCCAVLCCVA